MKYTLKQIIKQQSHSLIFKQLAAFGRALNRFYENRNHDLYSNGEEIIIKKIAKLKPQIIFDGGANIGKYTNILRKECPNAKIFSFEPVSETFNILKKNLSNLKNIELINKGFYKEICTKSINLFESNTHSTIYNLEKITKKAEKVIDINLIAGDDFIKEQNIKQIDFLKLDVEGAEYSAIEGFKNALKNKKIRAIQFEYGYINIKTKKLLIDFYEYFDNFGYIVGKIFPKTVEFRDYHFMHDDFLGPNFIVVHKDDKELIKLLKNNKKSRKP